MYFRKLLFFYIVCSFVILNGCKSNDPVGQTTLLQLTSIKIQNLPLNLAGTVTTGLAIDQPILITFSAPVDLPTVASSISLKNGSTIVDVNIAYLNNYATISLTPKQVLANNTSYTISISSQLVGAGKQKFGGIDVTFKTIEAQLLINSLSIGGKIISGSDRIIDIPQTLSVVVSFTQPIDPSTVTSSSVSLAGPGSDPLIYSFSSDKKTLTITRTSNLTYLTKYSLTLTSDVKGAAGEVLTGTTKIFYTDLGSHTSGFATLTDDELLDKVQSQTIKYFYDFADPASGMARERDTSGNTVTTGGSGFGIMSLVVGIDRGFIPRADGIARLNKIVGFLEKANRFHGAWPHWIDGNTGKVIPFSTNDNGADLVETSFLTQGLITMRQYLNSQDTAGNNMINRITKLYDGVEWDWFRQSPAQNVLYWHWSPDKGFILNFALSGYFEEQITYFLAAGSSTHAIPKSVYVSGYYQNGASVTNNTYTFNGQTHTIPLGGLFPLFWTQYSYLGLNPNFTDDYVNYWTQNVNASLVDHDYCTQNPKKFPGYGDNCWGLTASDTPSGYGAQSPDNDNGTITPTAALSAFPYTPTESMKALKFFYYSIGDRLFGKYGFYDAFNVSSGWTATSTLAIDQGPIVVMIENYRTKLLWNLFESAPEVMAAKTKLNFH